MTLGDLRDAAALEPPEVRASRRRAIVLRMQRLTRCQRDRELLDLGYRDLGGEG